VPDFKKLEAKYNGLREKVSALGGMLRTNAEKLRVAVLPAELDVALR
jgi:hypothetical protein